MSLDANGISLLPPLRFSKFNGCTTASFPTINKNSHLAPQRQRDYENSPIAPRRQRISEPSACASNWEKNNNTLCNALPDHPPFASFEHNGRKMNYCNDFRTVTLRLEGNGCRKANSLAPQKASNTKTPTSCIRLEHNGYLGGWGNPLQQNGYLEKEKKKNRNGKKNSQL